MIVATSLEFVSSPKLMHFLFKLVCLLFKLMSILDGGSPLAWWRFQGKDGGRLAKVEAISPSTLLQLELVGGSQLQSLVLIRF
jgi:hypothetical protein